MPFGTATVLTNKGKAMAADRLRTTPATYTVAMKFLGLGTGATGAARTAVAADTALSTELGEGRATCTESVVTTSQTNDTTQFVGTVTATGTRAVDEAGLFDASTTGNMGLSATFAVVNLTNGDSLQITAKIQFT